MEKTWSDEHLLTFFPPPKIQISKKFPITHIKPQTWSLNLPVSNKPECPTHLIPTPPPLPGYQSQNNHEIQARKGKLPSITAVDSLSIATY